MREPTDRAVKRAAISSMMMPTGTLVLRPMRAKIQPLAEAEKNSKPNSHCESVLLHNGTCKDGAGKKGIKKEPPCSPAGDADGLQDVNAELADVDEEKDEEAE